MAASIGFSSTNMTLIATAISELARNIVEYAQHGEIIISMISENGRKGISIVARDNGPGIADVAQALQDGYSSRRSLGLGLPGTRRIVDEFDINSHIGEGTTVVVKKWEK